MCVDGEIFAGRHIHAAILERPGGMIGARHAQTMIGVVGLVFRIGTGRSRRIIHPKKAALKRYFGRPVRAAAKLRRHLQRVAQRFPTGQIARTHHGKRAFFDIVGARRRTGAVNVIPIVVL